MDSVLSVKQRFGIIGDNPKLIALMLDKNPESVNDSWDKFCDAIEGSNATL